MIQKVVGTWHRVIAGERLEALDGLLAADVVFYSPIVCTPQRHDTGHIVAFRVMMRPLQAINAVHEQMSARFASMQPPRHPDRRR